MTKGHSYFTHDRSRTGGKRLLKALTAQKYRAFTQWRLILNNFYSITPFSTRAIMLGAKQRDFRLSNTVITAANTLP
jgi:hypothetical protein